MNKQFVSDKTVTLKADIPLSVQPCVQNRDYPHEWWLERHQTKQQEKQSRSKSIQLVFIGDSITQAWEDKGKKVWHEQYEPLGTLNLGFNGDCTEHVIWRIENGALDELAPKVIILMVGTNNAGHRKEKPQHTSLGTQSIIELIRRKCPSANILLLAIFPRGKTVDDPLRQLTEETNQYIEQLADDDKVHWLNLNHLFLNSSGELTPEIATDFLHINEKQYRVWAEAMTPSISRLMKSHS